jgi:hypothetical protein
MRAKDSSSNWNPLQVGGRQRKADAGDRISGHVAVINASALKQALLSWSVQRAVLTGDSEQLDVVIEKCFVDALLDQ